MIIKPQGTSTQLLDRESRLTAINKSGVATPPRTLPRAQLRSYFRTSLSGASSLGFTGVRAAG
jgi:hypothetical protein